MRARTQRPTDTVHTHTRLPICTHSHATTGAALALLMAFMNTQLVRNAPKSSADVEGEEKAAYMIKIAGQIQEVCVRFSFGFFSPSGSQPIV